VKWPVGSAIPKLTSQQPVCYIPLSDLRHGSNVALLCLEDAPWYCDPVWYWWKNHVWEFRFSERPFAQDIILVVLGTFGDVAK
jgi:hypothetical protein